MVYYYLFSVFLSKVLFSGFLQFKSNFVNGQNTCNSKYRDIHVHIARQLSYSKKKKKIPIMVLTLVSDHLPRNHLDIFSGHLQEV